MTRTGIEAGVGIAAGLAGTPVVKVCGITRVEDALTAASLGAQAIGFIFWEGSPRLVTMAAAREIASELPPFVATVGVFVNQAPRTVLEVATMVPLSVVQFHGDESEEDVVAFPWRRIRAVALDSAEARERLARLPHTITVLLDAHDPRRRGGTGRQTNWADAAAVAVGRRVLLAGGLRADNVGEAIRTVRPWGLDVSSGVESAPGVKDASKMRAFFDAVRSATAGGLGG